ncbi:uncharacterized protein LOC144342558 [Saccoglossus kowalevskii]
MDTVEKKFELLIEQLSKCLENNTAKLIDQIHADIGICGLSESFEGVSSTDLLHFLKEKCLFHHENLHLMDHVFKELKQKRASKLLDIFKETRIKSPIIQYWSDQTLKEYESFMVLFPNGNLDPTMRNTLEKLRCYASEKTSAPIRHILVTGIKINQGLTVKLNIPTRFIDKVNPPFSDPDEYYKEWELECVYFSTGG